MDSGATTIPPVPPAIPRTAAPGRPLGLAAGMPYFVTPPLAIIDHPADSRHLGPPRDTAKITLIVLHSTVGGLESSLDWLSTNPNSVVSVHRLVAKSGDIYKIAPDERVCNHVGFSRMGNTTNLNPMSLGIELENLNTGHDPYTARQLVSAAAQIVEWFGLFGMLPIVSHASVDTKGKTDPAGFPWAVFSQLLFDRLRGVL